MPRTKKRTGVRTKKRTTTRRTGPIVFIENGCETIDDMHRVYWSKSGDLNKGKCKKFTNWREALKFGQERAREWGVKPVISKC